MLKFFVPFTVFSTIFALSLVNPIFATTQKNRNSAVSIAKTRFVTKTNVLSSSNLIADISFGSDILEPDQYLIPDQYLTSSNGKYKFILQSDGNLVLYVISKGKAVWSSNTAGRSSGQLYMQADGNLVIYNKRGRPIWASNTAGYPGSHLVVQNDRNVVIYTPNGQPIWSTNTAIVINGSDSGGDDGSDCDRSVRPGANCQL